MIDHTQFTEAYHKYNDWLCLLAKRQYPRDPLAIAADTWEKVWSNRARIKTIGYELLYKIVRDLVRTLHRDSITHLRHFERYARTVPQTTEDIDWAAYSMRIVANDLTPSDKRILDKLVKYSETPGGKLKGTGIPRSTLVYFRKRVRRYKTVEIF